MKTTITAGLLSVILLVLMVLACDTPDTSPTPVGHMRLSFDNVVGSSDLTLNTGSYQNAAGESFTVTKFNYFVSNIRLRNQDGSEYVVPQDSSYFLIQEDRPASQTITLNNVPVGNYTGVTFLIGVDSLRNLADLSKRTGVLDPGLTTHDPMYWDWNTGYVFLKLEGTSSAAPAAQNNLFLYHLGGFGRNYDGKQTVNNLRTVTIPFRNDLASVQTSATPTVRLTTDALKVFNGPTQLSIAQHSSVMFETYSTNIADNCAQMISYDRLQAN
ncbi:MbnP family protein [Spirosoma koreense]